MQATKRLMAMLVSLALALAGCTNMPEEATNGTGEGDGADDAWRDDTPMGGLGDVNDDPDVGNDSGTGADSGASDTTAQPVELTEGFEQDLAAWTRGSDLPGGANDDAWSANVTTDAAHGGQQALALSTGQAGQGTLWLTRTIEGLTPGAGYGVRMSVWAQPHVDVPEGALNDLVLYVGGEAPTGDGSFTPENAGSRHMAARAPLPATGEWQEYTLDWGTPGPENGTMVVAIGISSSADADVTYLLDDLQLAFEPKPA